MRVETQVARRYGWQDAAPLGRRGKGSREGLLTKRARLLLIDQFVPTSIFMSVPERSSSYLAGMGLTGLELPGSSESDPAEQSAIGDRGGEHGDIGPPMLMPSTTYTAPPPDCLIRGYGVKDWLGLFDVRKWSAHR